MKFQEGGIVPGQSTRGDSVLAGVNSGEMILNRSQQSSLFNAIASGGVGGGGGTSIVVEGNIIADDDQQVDLLIERMNDAIEFRNVVLRPENSILT